MKLPIAPASGAAACKIESSAPGSKSAACTRIDAISAAGDGREEGYLVTGPYRGFKAGEGLVDRNADQARIGKRGRIAGPTGAQGGNDITGSFDVCGEGKILKRAAGVFTQPGEIQYSYCGHAPYLGVGTVVTLPVGEITVLVPLPFGTRMLPLSPLAGAFEGVALGARIGDALSYRVLTP